MNELLITELKHVCDDFANKLMEMFKGVRVEFSGYDEDERFQDAMKDEQKENEWKKCNSVQEYEDVLKRMRSERDKFDEINQSN